MLISWQQIKRFKQSSCGCFWDGRISGACVFPLLWSLYWHALISGFLPWVRGSGLQITGELMTGGTGPGYTTVPFSVFVCVCVRVRACELAATILILFVQTDPVPFYFQLVENKLVLFLLSVAMTTQPFLVDLEKSRKSKASVLFFQDLWSKWRLHCDLWRLFFWHGLFF